MIAKYRHQELEQQRRESRLDEVRLGLLARRQSDSDGDDDLPLPSTPTEFWCGTREKLDVMRQRVEAGEALFHPEDSQMKIMRSKDEWDTRIRFDEADGRKMPMGG